MTGQSGDFALQLRALRETHGLTVRALAERVGVSKVTIWKWERGDNEPRSRHLLPLARALNVRPDELRTAEAEVLANASPGESGVDPAIADEAGTEAEPRGQARDLAEVVARAKQMIADASGVGPKNISITIEY